jgi:hypothetical protein
MEVRPSFDIASGVNFDELLRQGPGSLQPILLLAQNNSRWLDFHICMVRSWEKNGWQISFRLRKEHNLWDGLYHLGPERRFWDLQKGHSCCCSRGMQVDHYRSVGDISSLCLLLLTLCCRDRFLSVSPQACRAYGAILPPPSASASHTRGLLLG